jgi:predicted nucleic acid-binding protein
VTHLLIDTSVLITWFHHEGEEHVDEARALLRAHMMGGLRAHVLDLAVYEMANVLLRALHWRADDVADQIQDLLVICGPPLQMTMDWTRNAAELAEHHGLTFYDAAWAAVARGLNLPLVTGDRQLLAAGLAISAPAAVQQLIVKPNHTSNLGCNA